MIKFIRNLIASWRGYPDYIIFLSRFSDEQKKYTETLDAKSGIKPYKSRFDYAYRNAKIYHAHRDRYSRKCRKYKGDCVKCNAKHC